jgi:hypothetical protein
VSIKHYWYVDNRIKKERRKIMCFSVRKGLITGRNHIVYRLNCQDSILTKTFVFEEKNYYIGAVSDGCGEGKRSEVGSHLAVTYLVNKTQELILKKVPEEEIPSILFKGLIWALETVKENFLRQPSPPEETVDFIKNHLLFTVLGYYITPRTCTIYAMGDGVVLINDLIDIRNENNHPNYIAYNLVDGKYLQRDRKTLPDKFDVYKIPTPKLNKMAVGTDAWEDEIGVFISLWDKSICTNIQRTMNLLSTKEKRFKDDAAIIAIERENTTIREGCNESIN